MSTHYFNFPSMTRGMVSTPSTLPEVPRNIFTIDPPTLPGTQDGFYALHPLSNHESNDYKKLAPTIIGPYTTTFSTSIETAWTPKSKCLLIHTPDANIQSNPLRSSYKSSDMSRAFPGVCNQDAALFFGTCNNTYAHINSVVNYLTTTFQAQEMRCSIVDSNFDFDYPASSCYNPYEKIIKERTPIFTDGTLIVPAPERLAQTIQILGDLKPNTPLDYVLNLVKAQDKFIINPVLVLSLWQIISLIMTQSLPVITSENLTDKDIDAIATKSVNSAPCGSAIVTLYVQLVAYILMMMCSSEKLYIGSDGIKTYSWIPENFKNWMDRIMGIKLGPVSIVDDSSINYQIQIIAARTARIRILIENTIPIPAVAFREFPFPGLICFVNAALPGKITVPRTAQEERLRTGANSRNTRNEDVNNAAPADEIKPRYWPTESINLQFNSEGLHTISTLCHGGLFVSPMSRSLSPKLLDWISKKRGEEGASNTVRSMVANIRDCDTQELRGPMWKTGEPKRGFRNLTFGSRYIQVKQVGGGFTKLKKTAGYRFTPVGTSSNGDKRASTTQELEAPSTSKA